MKRQRSALKEACRDAATAEFLHHHGYCVNVARRPKVKRELPGDHKPTVLVIDDDPDICSLLQTYLKMEGFASRTAANRGEILAELRRSPLPDLVLLDVGLPDANGFDIHHMVRAVKAALGLENDPNAQDWDYSL